ncbi:MAG: amidase [Burkholderiaceae bacterium]|uniref:amidase n=1 Tax=Hydrogenophaga sp. TaxID=1904254 RepID=UPI002753A05D|nr:amidase [Hydrogenophaga sp.]MDP2065895.1 amidase [Burkholderiaceae bacterium]MDZ4144006.1 amidase [Burkholderiales bacterium]MDZ4398831.1 amidase [Hydrogenophaga sp.]
MNPAPSSITDWNAETLSRRIHARDVSCREVMQAYLARIHRVNPTYNAIVSLQPDDLLLRQADARDAQLARGESMGWMHGMPQAVKDLAHVAGLPTTLGSPLMRHFIAKEDGLMVARMKAAGCLVIGKTNTPEFGLGSHTFNEVFGVTRNAWDPTRSAGGSSGGAAVALAQRLLPVADGSDFMGSLRNPAGWNHVFGLRPSQGRVPMAPAQDLWLSQLGTEGPMGRTVQDVARLLGIQAGWSPDSPLSIANYDLSTGSIGQFDLKNLRIGWLGDLGGHLPMEDGILPLCRSALDRLTRDGAVVDEVAPGFDPVKVWDAWRVWRRVLVASRIAPFLLNPKNRAQIKPEALWEYDQAQGLPATEFLAASTQRSVFYQQMCAQLARYDVLALPVAQVWPFDASLRWPQQIGTQPMDTYHRWMEVVIYATFAGLPCISVPAGFGPEGNAKGLPMGVQLIGQPQGERALLDIAAAYEQRAQELLQSSPSQQAR